MRKTKSAHPKSENEINAHVVEFNKPITQCRKSYNYAQNLTKITIVTILSSKIDFSDYSLPTSVSGTNRSKMRINVFWTRLKVFFLLILLYLVAILKFNGFVYS